MTAAVDTARAAPRRVAHAALALLEARDATGTPCTTREVCLYDKAALTVDSTRRALQHGIEHGLVDRWSYRPALWTPTSRAHDARPALEGRIHAEQEDEQ